MEPWNKTTPVVLALLFCSKSPLLPGVKLNAPVSPDALTPSLQCQLSRRNEVLNFESVDKIPCCDHSNEISFTVLLHGTICLAGFEKLKIVIFLEFLLWPLLGVKGLTCSLLKPSLTNRPHFGVFKSRLF